MEVTSQRWTWFVLAFWALLLAGDLAFVARYGLSFPFADELRWVGVLTGDEPITATWLVQPENMHRLPAVKLFYLGLAWASDYRFQAGGVVSVTLLGSLALAMLLVVRRFHGGQFAPTDVVAPLLLLHLGHYQNLTWGFQLAFVVPVALCCTVLLLVATVSESLTLPRALAVAACLGLMALCGGPGICYLPMLALWLTYAGFHRWLSTGDRKDHLAGVAIVALSLACAAAVPLYFLSLRDVDRTEGFGTAGAWTIARGSLQFLTSGIGRMGKELWPVSGGVAVLAIGVLGFWLTQAWRSNRQQRVRVAGLACFALAVMATGLAIAVSRTQIEPDYCFTSRYVLLSTPLVLCIYLTGVLYGPALPHPRLAPALGLGYAVLAVAYASNGVHHARILHQRVTRAEVLIREGAEPAAVAEQCANDVHSTTTQLQHCLEQMQAAGIGPFRGLRMAQRNSEGRVSR